MSPWFTIVWLIVSFSLLIPLTRWFSRRAQALFLLITGEPDRALLAYFFLLFPGVLLHEASHWLVAALLGVRTGKLSIRPKVKRGGKLQMGALQFHRSDVVRESLIGLAPLVAGTAVVLLVARNHFGLDVAIPWRLELLRGQLALAAQATDAWVWVYLMVAVCNAMLPSASDRSSWRTLALYLVLVSLALCLGGALGRVPAQVVNLGIALARHLALAFSMSVVLDLATGCALWGTERLLGLVFGQRLQVR